MRGESASKQEWEAALATVSQLAARAQAASERQANLLRQVAAVAQTRELMLSGTSSAASALRAARVRSLSVTTTVCSAQPAVVARRPQALPRTLQRMPCCWLPCMPPTSCPVPGFAPSNPHPLLPDAGAIRQPHSCALLRLGSAEADQPGCAEGRGSNFPSTGRSSSRDSSRSGMGQANQRWVSPSHVAAPPSKGRLAWRIVASPRRQ